MQNKHFKSKIIGVVLVIALFSCVNNTLKEKTINQTPIESTQNNLDKQIATTENATVEKSTKFYIKDETKYSDNFISAFKKYHEMYEAVSLIEDTIIINNDRENIIIIPTDFPLNKMIIYEKAEKEKEQILTVKRVNFSTLK